MRWVEDEIDAHQATQKRLEEAVALLKDIVDRQLLPVYTDNKVRSFLLRLPTEAAKAAEGAAE